MGNRTRKTKKEMVAELDVDCVSLKNLHDEVGRLMSIWGPDALVEETVGYCNSRSTDVYVVVPESDEEMETRIQMEERRQEQLVQRELQELARLTAKFGKQKG